MTHAKIILGSSSPRREEILSFFSLPFSKATSHFDEESITFTGDATCYVETLAQEKGNSLSSKYPDDIIITADTVVYFNDKVYNKPKSKEEAISFLKELSGNWHTVYTSVTLTSEKKQHTQTEQTNILFHKLTDKQIDHYLDHINYLDKAGSYAIQQGGSLIVKKIDGCYYNVMGLPINALYKLLQLVDIDLWEHMRIL